MFVVQGLVRSVVVWRRARQQSAGAGGGARGAAGAARAARPVDARASPLARHEPEPVHYESRRTAAGHRVPHLLCNVLVVGTGPTSSWHFIFGNLNLVMFPGSAPIQQNNWSKAHKFYLPLVGTALVHSTNHSVTPRRLQIATNP